MKIKQQYEVRRVLADRPFTTGNLGSYEETFTSRASALKAIESWYQENLTPAGALAIGKSFIIIPITIVSQ